MSELPETPPITDDQFNEIKEAILMAGDAWSDWMFPGAMLLPVFNEMERQGALGMHLYTELGENDELNTRMDDILSRTAIALHGGPLENGLWSWHDLPELVESDKAEIKRLRDLLMNSERCPVCGQPDNCGDCTHQPMGEGT